MVLFAKKKESRMSLKTFVKISNVSSLSDARYCAGMGVDILGFNIDPDSVERISPEDFKEITDWVAGVKFAGEFRSSDIENIKTTVKDYPIDYIEISNTDLVEKVGLLQLPILFKVFIESDEDLKGLASKLSYLDELISHVIIKSSNEELFDELDQQISFYNGNLRLLKGYEVTASDSIAKFPGLEMEATKEEKPGFKDYGEIMDVLEVIEED